MGAAVTQLVLVCYVFSLFLDGVLGHPLGMSTHREENSGEATDGSDDSIEPTANNRQDVTDHQHGRSDVNQLHPSYTNSSTDATTAQDPCLSLCLCDTEHVNCSSRGLTQIPSGLPSDLQYLDLSNNNLSQLAHSQLEGLPDLREIDLNFNQLSEVSIEVFSHNHHLHSLYLQNNLLSQFMSCSNGELIENTTTETLENDTSPGQCNITRLQMLDLSGNDIKTLPVGFLSMFPELTSLVLDQNHLSELTEMLTLETHPLQHLSLIDNNIETLYCRSLQNLSMLQNLNLGYNQLRYLPEAMCSEQLPRLTTLTLNGNSLIALSPGAFMNLTSLTGLSLSHLSNLRYLAKDTFAGLPNLQYLDLSHNQNLEFIHATAFSTLYLLQELDLSDCDLSWLHSDVVQDLRSLEVIRLTGNPWYCDCDLKWLPNWLQQRPNQRQDLQANIVCTSPSNVMGQYLDVDISETLECQGPVIVNSNATVWSRIGEAAVLDCVTEASAKIRVRWETPKDILLEYHPGYHNFYATDPNRAGYHSSHAWHDDTSYNELTYDDRIAVLYNGSLYIDYVTRKDAGSYRCMVETGYWNETVIVPMRIDSSTFQYVKIYSMIMGAICAFTFFFIAMLSCTIHYYSIKFSSKERKKRKSIREVLNSLHDFKTVQIDRLCAYKTSKLNKLSAFKSAKMHKLVAFKTAKVGKLRNYKQVTMASIFHHMEKMREHYNSQINRVRDNCSQQAEKLRENYTSQVIKIKDYKSEKLDRIRDNYNSQVIKIRDGRAFQMNKLRDQYKLQQQHLLKLMELLGIGNCLQVVEAECMRTESMIFNPNIAFDLEAEPVHVMRGADLSDEESEYMTAGSQSDLSVSDHTLTSQAQSRQRMNSSSQNSQTCSKHKDTARMKERTRGQRGEHQRQGSNSSDSSTDQPTQHEVVAISEPPPPPTFSSPAHNGITLEQLVTDTEEAIQYYADLDADDLSMYETPAGSAHQDIQCAIDHTIPHDVSPSRDSNTDSMKTAYGSVAQSREQSPEPQSGTPHDNHGSVQEEKQQPLSLETIV